MNKKLICALLLLVSVRSTLPLDCQEWGRKSPQEKGFIIGVVSVVAAGISYLLYKAFTWELSNEKMFYKAQHVYDSLHATYKTLDFLKADTPEGLPRFTEQDLATIAVQRDVKILAAVAHDLRSLQHERDALHMRIHRDGAKADPIIEEMRVLHNDMKKLEAKLSLLDHFWQEYSAFFELYDYHKLVVGRYENARADVYEAELVRRAIMAMSIGSNASYPYLHFVEALNQDCDGLKQRMNNAIRYEVLYGRSERLYESLTGLLGTAVSLPEYKEELHLQKQHQLEQERVNAMREQAAAEREKANAMHQQVWATLAKPTPQPRVTVHVHNRDTGA